MRTTLDLPVEMLRKLETLAAQRDITVEQLLRTAVENELERAGMWARERRGKFPVLDSKEPGVLNISNADIEELLG